MGLLCSGDAQSLPVSRAARLSKKDNARTTESRSLPKKMLSRRGGNSLTELRASRSHGSQSLPLRHQLVCPVSIARAISGRAEVALCPVVESKCVLAVDRIELLRDFLPDKLPR